MQARKVEGKNGSKSYRVQLMVNGERKSFTAETGKIAKELAAQYAIDVKRKERGEVLSVPLTKAIERYLDTDKKSASNKFRGEFPTIVKQLGSLADKNLDRWDESDVEGWIEAREGEVETATIRRQYNTLKRLFKVARKKWKYLRNSPFDNVDQPDDGEARLRGVTDPEFNAMIEELGYTFGMEPTRDAHYVAIAMYIARETGMRKGEILGLSNDDRTFRRPGEFFLALTKNGHSRTVPIWDQSEALLATLPKTGKVIPVCSSTFTKIFGDARKSLGLGERGEDSYWRFHDLRCEAITRMVASGLDPVTVSKVSGHRDLTMLRDHYYRLDVTTLKSPTKKH